MEKLDAVRTQLESMHNEFRRSMETFNEEFQAARDEYSQSDHSSEEWRAFSEEWRAEQQALEQDFRADLEAFGAANNLGDCAQYVMPPPMGGGQGGQQGPRNYEQQTQAPMGNRFYEEDEEVRQIRAECEAEAKEILGEYWREPGQRGGMQPGQGTQPGGPGGQGGPGGPPRSQSFQGPPPPPGGGGGGGAPPPGGSGAPPPGGSMPPPSGSMPPPGGSGMPPPSGSRPPPGSGFPSGSPRPSGMQGDMPSQELMQQVHEVMRECEKRIREHFKSLYEEQKFDESRQNAFGSFEMFFDEESGLIQVTGKYLSFVGNPDSQILSGITCGGESFIEELKVDGFLDFDLAESGQGTVLQISSDGETTLKLHDNPQCVINMATTDDISEIDVDFEDYFEGEEGGNGIRYTDGEVNFKLLLHSGAFETSENNLVQLFKEGDDKGKASFIVLNSAGVEAGGNPIHQDLNFQQAVEEGDVGGDITIIGEPGNITSDETSYGDLDMNVTQPEEDTLLIDLESNESAGKTVVITIDESVMSVDQLDEIVVNVYALLENANRTEDVACSQEAEDLQDILDPNDDGDCYEYWVVLDKNGVQVLISVPHWSAKRVEIQSTGGDGGFLGMPNVGILGAALAAVAALTLIGVALRRKP